MADFQSFLLQNMQLIGLEDEDDENDAKTTNTKTTKSSQASSSNSKYSTRDSIQIKSPVKFDKISKNKQETGCNKNLASSSNITTDTFLSGSNSNGLSKNKISNKSSDENKNKKNYNVIEDDANESSASNSSSPKLVYKKANKSKNADLDDSNNYHLKSLGSFTNNKAPLLRKKNNPNDIYSVETNFVSLETNMHYNNLRQRSPSKSSTTSNSSTRDLSSPESILKTDFKSSTPIVVSHGLKNSKYQESFMSNSNYERVIKSPKLLKNQSNSKFSQHLQVSSSESLNYRRVSSQQNNKQAWVMQQFKINSKIYILERVCYFSRIISS